MAKKAPPPPLDAATILRLKTELETQFRLQDVQIRDTRAVREMKDDVAGGLVDRYTDIIVRDPTVADEIARNSATLSLNPAKVTCTYAPSGSEPAEHDTTLRELFYTELLEDASTRIEGVNARTRGIDMCLGDGGVWMKVVFAKELWEESGALRRRRPGESAAEYDQSTEQAKKEGGQPFVIIAVDPLSFFPVRSGTKLVGAMEVQRRPLTQTLLQYNLTIYEGEIVPAGTAADPGVDGHAAISPASLGQPQNKWDAQMEFPSTVEFVEFWDEYRCYQVLYGIGQNGYLLPPWEHGYGRPPYFSGMGFMMGHWANRKVGWGIAETKRWLVQYSSFLKTVLADVAARDAYTPVIHTVGEQTAASLMGKDGKPEFTEDFHAELREVLRAYPGDSWLQFPVRDIAPALKEAILQNAQDIQATLTPKVTSNIGGGMEGAGYAINTVLQEAKVTHHPYVQNLERMYTEIVRFIDWLIVNKVKTPVWLFTPPRKNKDGVVTAKGGWLSLGPDDITRYPVKVNVEIDPDQPSAQLIEGRYWQEQVQDGFADMDTAIRAQGRNPDAIREGRTKDRIRASDWFMAFQDKVVTQEMGYGHLLAMSKLAQQVAQTGGLPGLQPPPGPGPANQPPNTAGSGPPAPSAPALALSPGGKAPDMANVGAGPGPGNQGNTFVEVPTQSAAAGMSSPAAR